MKAAITSSVILLGSVGLAFADARTLRIVDAQADPRVENVDDVNYEGSGLTTADAAGVEVAETPTSTAELSDGMPEGSPVEQATLDDGTVVDNRKTPATARVENGRVETSGGEVAGAIVDAEPVRAPIEREGYARLAADDPATVGDLVGLDLYDATDERVGEVEDVMDGANGPVAITDIGGFLGLGERRVAILVRDLDILRGEDELRVYADMTEEELEALPEL
ncbi:PRC-barrel domain-containing protein [Jannaschia sp. LMIT008]|uniref:PRC-barrel domain-containing protein n=1 Tax=Jannaschia maritima TaxID=3032585 RepID=UPI002811E094|nr:PRC-barrel domain-containing protein [Jannaschia sp. LMIT008]